MISQYYIGMAEANRGCYRIDTRKYATGLYDEAIDATYILHLEGNGRWPQIEQQLRDIHPTRTLHILMNKGYKRCQKELREQNSKNDLTDAVITIFQDALDRGYEAILLLEDDFIFGPAVSQKESVESVKKFVGRHTGTDYIYQLGSIPLLRISLHDDVAMGIGGTSHANIYSKAAMQRIIDSYRVGELNGHIDMYHMAHAAKNGKFYIHGKPLIYQTFPMTENRASWAGGDLFGRIQEVATNWFIWATGMDRHPEPGTSILYFLSLVLPILLIAAVGWAGYAVACWIGVVRGTSAGRSPGERQRILR